MQNLATNNICSMCNKKFNSKIGLSNHIKKHKISKEEYYIKYIGKQTFCKNCGNKTILNSLTKGFRRFCCVYCANSYNIKNNINLIKSHGTEEFRAKISIGRSSVEAKEKFSNTMIKKYGYSNPLAVKEFKEKAIKTNIKKYGYNNPAKNCSIKEKIKKTSIINGWQISEDKKPEFLYYSLLVKKETNKKRKKLFENWDGYDYYDNEYIKNNLQLNYQDRNYPTIDHKISVLEGFKQNLSIEQLTSFENLCITKKWINSSKYTRNKNE